MTMTLRLHHHAGYTYSGGASASYNEARMQPQSNAEQTVLHTQVDVSPHPWAMTWTDYWGTLVTSFEVHERHPELRVDATTTVTVDRRGTESEKLSWEAMSSTDVVDTWEEVLDVSERVAPGEELAELVAGIRETSETPAAFVASVIDLIRSRVEYRSGGTTVYAHASSAWTGGAGAAQDIAHLAIGALRSQGIPARYVAGYMLPTREPQVGHSYSGEAHAWIQWWDGAWVSLDPCAGGAPDDSYVEVGVARDHRDLLPLSGIFTGAPGSQTCVSVEVTRLS